mgnify:CR=1 FL=1
MRRRTFLKLTAASLVLPSCCSGLDDLTAQYAERARKETGNRASRSDLLSAAKDFRQKAEAAMLEECRADRSIYDMEHIFEESSYLTLMAIGAYDCALRVDTAIAQDFLSVQAQNGLDTICLNPVLLTNGLLSLRLGNKKLDITEVVQEAHVEEKKFGIKLLADKVIKGEIYLDESDYGKGPWQHLQHLGAIPLGYWDRQRTRSRDYSLLGHKTKPSLINPGGLLKDSPSLIQRTIRTTPLLDEEKIEYLRSLTNQQKN